MSWNLTSNVCKLTAGVFLLVCCLNSNAAENCVEGDRYDSSLPDSTQTDIVTIEGPIFDGGIVQCEIDAHDGMNKRIRREVGTIDGLRYVLYYSDLSGSVEQAVLPHSLYSPDMPHPIYRWNIRCGLEKSPQAYCYISRGEVSVAVDSSGTKISIADPYDDSDIEVQIDDFSPIVAKAPKGFSISQTEKLLTQMRSECSNRLRYDTWSRSSDNPDGEIQLRGFSQGWQVLSTVYWQFVR